MNLSFFDFIITFKVDNAEMTKMNKAKVNKQLTD